MIWEIIKNTIAKEYRNRTILPSFIITIIYIVGLNMGLDALENLVASQGLDSMLDLKDNRMRYSIYFIQFWAAIISISLGAGLVLSDIKDNAISLFLVLPMKRFFYLFGRLTGATFLISAFILISFSLIYFLSPGALLNLEYLGKGILVVFLLSLGCFLVICFSVLLSFFISEKLTLILGVIFMTLVFVSNTFFRNVPLESVFREGVGFFNSIGFIIHYAFPRLGNLVWITSSLFSSEVVAIKIASMELLHFGLTLSLWVWCIKYLFDRYEV